MIGKLSHEQAIELLQENSWGRIGCNDGDKTYIVPVSYIYDGQTILAHSLEGMKIDMMRKWPKVCFEVDEIKNLCNWKSVILWGEYQELNSERERYYAMRLFTERMIQLKTVNAALQKLHPQNNNNVRPVFYRIVIAHITGRFENE